MQNKDNNLEKTRQDFNKIIADLEKMAIKRNSFHSVEYHIFKSLLQLGKNLLIYYICLLRSLSEKKFESDSKVKLNNKGVKKRVIFSIFGEVDFKRNKFYSPDTNTIYYPLDNALALQAGKYSYRLQDWIGFGASDQDFRCSVELLNRIFAYNFSGMQSERIACANAIEVDNFYETTETKKETEEGEYFAVGFDDKGVPIKASDIDREQDSKIVRLGKGQKRGVKKNCTVSVGYSFDAKVREPKDIIDNLFEDKKNEKQDNKPTEDSQWAQNKHIRGFLGGKKQAINYGFDDILERKKDTDAKIVVLIDGDRSLERVAKEVVDNKGIGSTIYAYILDFIHVTEYVWKAANANFGEKSKLRVGWVESQCLLILQSKVTEVIQNVEEFKSKHEGNITKEKSFQTVITYFTNHEHMMDYQTYLKSGFPISTGAIESACGHFVQSRMEKNGMRWSMSGAQKILDLRAINKNRNWDEYVKYYIKKEQKKIGAKYKMVA